MLSTHNLAEVELSCDRIIMLARGRVRAAGTMDELQAAAAGEDRYVVECTAEGVRDAVAALPGVGEVHAAGLDGAWQRLTVDGNRGSGDLREAIAGAIAARSGTVRELRREAPTLERLFVRLVEGDEIVPSREEAVA